MERILELVKYYENKKGETAKNLIENLHAVLNSGNNEEARGKAETALGHLKKIAEFDIHIKRLEQFIEDLKPKLKVSPLL